MRGIRVTEWQTGGRGEEIVFYALQAKTRLLVHRGFLFFSFPFRPLVQLEQRKGHPPIDAKSPNLPARLLLLLSVRC